MLHEATLMDTQFPHETLIGAAPKMGNAEKLHEAKPHWNGRAHTDIRTGPDEAFPHWRGLYRQKYTQPRQPPQ